MNSSAVLTTAGSVHARWYSQTGNNPGFLVHQPPRRPLRFRLGPQGALFVDGLFGGASTEWIPKSLTKMRELLALGDNWDGYGARAVYEHVVPVVLNVLALAFAEGEVPFPDLVPTTEGGVQVEWHVKGFDLEVDVHPTGEICVYVRDKVDGAEWEGTARAHPDRLLRALQRLRT